MGVNQCVCKEVGFDELLRLHRDEGLSFEGLKERTGCCVNCTSCEPYILLTLSTGVTDHPVLDQEEALRIIRSA